MTKNEKSDGNPKKMPASRAKPKQSERFKPISCVSSLEVTIAQLVRQGLLEDVDSALVNLARAAARLVDDNPTPQAIKVYEYVLTRLQSIGEPETNDFDLLLNELRSDQRDAG